MRCHTLQDVSLLKEKFKAISPHLNEKAKRIWCATEAKSHNERFEKGGSVLVQKATGISLPTIRKGLREVAEKNRIAPDRVRKEGGGRKKITTKYPQILHDLESLVEPLSRGDPESSLRWTCKSVRNLAEELNKKGYKLSFRTVCDLLAELEYSLQSNKKSKEGEDHPDRDKQFKYINKAIKIFQNNNLPAISVDTKKKENIGEYKNGGREYCPKGNPIKTKVHDFMDKKLGKAAPYGVYDLTKNRGWVSVGISHDTAEFAVNTIRTWWYKLGQHLYKKAKSILITADCGGSNGYRNRLWKVELQKLSNELKKEIRVLHFPPGTSKWNKIEHRMFSFITMNWRGKPLVTLETVVNLIGSTKTKSGLAIEVVLDNKKYEVGKKVLPQEFESINIEYSGFHREWNYVIKPQTNNKKRE